MIRQTAPLLLFSLLLASFAACIPQLFTPTTVGNVNGFLFPAPFGFFVPFHGISFNNPFIFPSTVTTGGVTTVNPGVVANFNTVPTQTPGAFNQNGTFNLNFNNTFNLNFAGTFNLNNSIPPAVNQNLTP